MRTWSGWVFSVGAGVVAVAALAVVAEIVHLRASEQELPEEARGPAVEPPRQGTEAILVLGFPSFRSGRLHPLQRWRTEIAARSMTPDVTSRLIFSGAARPGGRSEAAVMAEYAESEFGISPAQIMLETGARTTWENIANTLHLLRGADVVKIASDPIHARKGRRYLLRQDPGVAAHLQPAADYRLGERWWLKIPMLGYAVTAGRRGYRKSVRPDR